MDHRFLRYHETALRFIRELGAEFARALDLPAVLIELSTRPVLERLAQLPREPPRHEAAPAADGPKRA
jgi:type VI protein secretion system component VasA